MTLNELSNYPYIVTAIERYEKELAELYDDSAGMMSPDMSGMPHGKGGAGDKVSCGYEKNEKAIEELKTSIACLKKRLQKLDVFFCSIADEQTLQIFELRFKKQCTWQQIASRIGGNNSKDSVKQICYRYLKKVD